METLEAFFRQRHCESMGMHFDRFSEVLGEDNSGSVWQHADTRTLLLGIFSG
jgi:hypothetical protein